MIDTELLKEKNVLAVRNLLRQDDQKQFYTMLLDNIKINQNTLREIQEEPGKSPNSSIYSEGSNNPAFYQAMRDNIIEVSKNLLAGGIEAEFPAKINSCAGEQSCVDKHMSELSTRLVISKERAEEIYSSGKEKENNSTQPTASTPSGTPFKTIWKTDNDGTSKNNQITIPTDTGTSNNNKITYIEKDADTGYNYSVDWGDGKIENNLTKDATHTYSSAGTYTVSIYGKFPHIEFGKNSDGDVNTIESDARKLLSIEQWGDIKWSSMENAFNECTNVISNAQDKPNLSSVTSMKAMFSEAKSFNQDISGWDVSKIINMNSLFAYATKFNQDIGSWNVANVTDMGSMFTYAEAFNQDIGSWNVANVKDMNGMFESAKHFDQNLGNWEIGNVKSMKAMLLDTSLSSENYGYLLEGWHSQRVQPSVQLNVGDVNYNCTSLIQRDRLTSLWGWLIFDGDYYDEEFYDEEYCREYYNYPSGGQPE
jgi:surface protein